MMKSMTGFASATRETADASLSVTTRSVNHRHLDLQMRLPQALAALEPALRSRVQRQVARGRVEIMVTLQWRCGPAVEVELNVDVASAVASAVEQARARGLVGGPMVPGDLLRLPQVLMIRERAVDEDQLLRDRVGLAVEEVLDEALAGLDAMRIREGGYLRQDLGTRREAMSALVERIARTAEDGRASAEARLRQRVRELPADLAGDPSAVAQEIVRFLARSDVSEELVRLRGHLAHWDALAEAADPCGRKLDFLLQEMNREVNTIGSKVEGAGVSELVVEIKAELERMREQAQNVE